jgi:putative hydrolase of the HAD superfamily
VTIRAVFFDFGGVLGRFDRVGVRALEERFGLPDDSLVTALYRIPEWQAVAVGRLPESDWLDAVGRKLDELAGRPIPEIRGEWASAWKNVDEDVIGLAKSLRGRYRIGVLSNSTPRLETELLGANGIHDMWDVIINSARVGVAKPDARIYEIAAERIGVPPQACLHIDDLEHNVRGAEAAGFSAIHHKGDFTNLTSQLRLLGVGPSARQTPSNPAPDPGALH